MDTTSALTITGTAGSAPPQVLRVVEFETPSRPSRVWHVRDRVRRFARSMPFTPDQLDDICIAVGEAATNSIKHGRSPLYPRIHVRIQRHADALRVFVTDKGRGFNACDVYPPGPGDLCECGRGILCMRSLMDEVVFHRLDPGMCVELVKQVTPAQPPRNG
jgi:serine/threonine-protein kinase RsbW